MLENKNGNIYETRKDGGYRPITHQRSSERYHPRVPTPYGLPFKFGGYIYMAIPNKSPLKILEKM